ncbi:vacuolar protein sorting-associated protein VTA1 homolog isoform X5 [Phyllopteryx taeniolatus]|nr:vacuolar protein sorting-associated protein VTA1 homolog isoform X5 [Phyllopteryx taeniolatus]XP_061610924.1 vacuolar protein sorting-associated protein VTA1 homolog isoform X5 [Phyllopteryx taeniolatus]
MQTGMKLDSKTPECRKFLVKLMDQLESMKMELSDNESITQEVVGNAHIENYALKMFLYADNEDRAGRFHKNMIKSFYTSSLLLDVLSVFGELSDENIQHRKYARWKASYIHNCLKSGETPEAGPIGMDLEQEADGDEGFSGCAIMQGGSFRGVGGASSQDPGSGGTAVSGIGFTGGAESVLSGPPSNLGNVHIPPGAHAPANTPAGSCAPFYDNRAAQSSRAQIVTCDPTDAVKPVPMPRTAGVVDPALLHSQQQVSPCPPSPAGDVHLSAEDFTKAQKYCKYAGSALQYEDVSTAVSNLQKALKLLTTGQE